MKIGPGKIGQKNQHILAIAIVISWLWISEKYFANVTHTLKDPPWAPLKGSAILASSYLISDAQETVIVWAKKLLLFPGVNFFKPKLYFIKFSDSWHVYKIKTFAKGLKCMHKKFHLLSGNCLVYRGRESYETNFGNLKSRPGYPYRALGDWS